MANYKNSSTEISVDAEEKKEDKFTDTSLDKKVMVRSIAPWITGSPRVTSKGDISIPPKGTVMLSREEIIAQAQNGNKLLIGSDSVGSHATWYVEDSFTRSELSFDLAEDNKTQLFLSKDIIKSIFAERTMKAFQNRINEEIVTRAEKAYLMECITDLKLNDYQRIAYCIEYTGMKP